jgi:hypothetical protein
VLAQKQTQRPVEQSRRPKHKSTTHVTENTISLTNGAGKTGYLHTED